MKDFEFKEKYGIEDLLKIMEILLLTGFLHFSVVLCYANRRRIQ